MNMYESVIQTIIQGGAVGVAVFSMWITYKLASNHINHNTEASKELSTMLAKLIQIIDDKIK